MPLWSRLYNAVWLAFLCCVLIPRWMGKYAGPPVHVLLGLGMLALTLTNARRLAALPCPDRLKRVSKVAANLSGAQLVIGLAFGAVAHMWPDLPVVGTVLHAMHVMVALAILAQCASVATGHDMWEERECEASPPPPATPKQ
ncbi:MAG: hypothetical protein HY901_17590 [Deltaproteobacteria bacterium]|nr:hypothetical protein [Deltaproteobacteria bacterium]